MLDRVKSIREALARTRQAAFGRVATLLGATAITPELWAELEALLIQSDVGAETTLTVLQRAKDRVARDGVTQADGLKAILKSELRSMIADALPLDIHTFNDVRVILIVGTNGSGKTTTIAKLAAWYQAYGRSVLLAAGDTFRAAAGEQLEVWADRAGVPVVGGQPGSDPGAVIFDALQAARSRKVNIVLIDTAGRLHTKFNLMQELRKVRTVIAKSIPGAPHETWLVLDGTTGQNALTQAEQFKAAVDVTGVIITKLDGTAKGGIVFAVSHQLHLPIRFIGTGESMMDIAPFDADVFIDGLFD